MALICYVDTSALVKKYCEEIGSERLKSILQEAKVILTSTLTELELTSTIERMKHEAKLTSPDYRRVMRGVESDLSSEVISLITLDPAILSLAKGLIKKRRLRVPDSIQLASAVRAQEKAGERLRFVCSDHQLLEAARLEGLEGINP